MIAFELTQNNHLNIDSRMSVYRYGDMVFAKCQNYPYWPGKVIAFPSTSSYKVLFYGEKSQATIDQAYIFPFTDETYRKFSQESVAKSNRGLNFSLKVARKKFAKKKEGQASSSDQEDFFMEVEPKKQDISRKNKIVAVTRQPENPHIELGILLNAIADEASNYKSNLRKFTPEQQRRLRELLQPQSPLLLPSLIEFRVIDRFIVALKELDLWGIKEYPELNEVHGLIRKRYEGFKAIILSPSFASIPLRESKRQRVLQKVFQNRGVL